MAEVMRRNDLLRHIASFEPNSGYGAMPYELPDGNVIQVGQRRERFDPAELLFRPSIVRRYKPSKTKNRKQATIAALMERCMAVACTPQYETASHSL